MPDPATAPVTAMVLAAGLGLRLRPLTETVPKPLMKVGGRTMLDRVLDHLVVAGIARAVVNSHYLADQIEAHLAQRDAPPVVLSHEPDLLETGGGIAKALPALGPDPFFAANADIIWSDGPVPALARLAAAWDDLAMDALLLVQPIDSAIGFDGAGDFFLGRSGALRRRGTRKRAPYVFTGVQLLHPRLFAGCPVGAFSMNLLYDRALAARRLFGLVHDGDWYHVGTPQALGEADSMLGPTPREAARRAR